eukprot:46004-Eustigmatos_ZCMA.PRE.1
MPAWRHPPPTIFRSLLVSRIKSEETVNPTVSHEPDLTCGHWNRVHHQTPDWKPSNWMAKQEMAYLWFRRRLCRPVRRVPWTGTERRSVHLCKARRAMSAAPPPHS